jgi:hypothetical protein
VNAKTIVENVLTPARARELLTVNYFVGFAVHPARSLNWVVCCLRCFIWRAGAIGAARAASSRLLAQPDAQRRTSSRPSLVDVVQGLVEACG